MIKSNTEIKNFDFENGLDEWSITGNISISSDAKTGANSMQLKKDSAALTTITDIDQGSYTVSMWVKGSASGSRVTVSGTGGPDAVVKIDNAIKSDDWVQIAHRNVLVYNGQMKITIAGGATSGLLVDDILVRLDSNDNNLVKDWGFEEGTLDKWSVSGDVKLLADENVDTGKYAVRLGDQSEVSQIITVEPDTDYIAAVRLKVDEQDEYESVKQHHIDESESVYGIFVKRTSLGNRVNLGVRGTDKTVLRQAPSSTEGYALVTVSFHTSVDQTQVEIYANTIFDQNYKDSITVYENTEGLYPNGWQRPNPNKLDNTKLTDDWNTNGNQYAYVDNFDVFQMNNDYIKGADMSFLQVIEDCGGRYFANGVQQDALRILSNHGVNSILTMLFVHSGNEIYDWNTLTKMQTSAIGYDGEEVTGRQQVYDYFDKRHTVAMALRVQELGMTYTPSFHYSDTWISAAKAHMPYEWIEKDFEGNLSNPDIYMLTTAVYNYVYDILSTMKASGVDNIISIKNGNEQDGGLLFPVASGTQYAQHAAIISSSTAAGHAVYPGAFNTIHTNTGYDPVQFSKFFKNLLNYGADYEGMAFSLYGGREVTSQFRMMNAELNDEILKYCDYINVETGMSFTTSSPIGDKESTMALTKYYDVSTTGQYNFLLDYMQAPLDVPNPHGVMRGFYYWNSEAIAIYGAGQKAGETVDGTKRTLFNNGTANIKEMGSSKDGKMGDMVAGVYAYLMRGDSKPVSDEVYSPLKYSGNNFKLGTAVNITLSERTLTMKSGERRRLYLTIDPEDEVLDDYHVSYSSNDTEVVTVSPYGFVTALNAGTAVITVKIGTVLTTAEVVVEKAELTSAMTISYRLIRNKKEVDSGVVTEGGTISVKPYDKLKFTTRLDGNPIKKAVVYTVSNPQIAWWYGDTWQTDDARMRTYAKKVSVSAYEPVVQLNPVSEGTVSITAEAEDGEAIVNFKAEVVVKKVTKVTIAEGDSTVRAGRIIRLNAVIDPDDASFYKVNWSSADETVAKVDRNGTVTGIIPGKTTIIVTSDADESIKDSIILTVTEVQVEELLLSRKTLAVLIGDQKKLGAAVVPDNAVDKSVSWSVRAGDEQVISVNQDGTVTGLSAGTGVVIVTANDGSGVQAECIVTVQEEAVIADGMELSESEVWIKSNYFSPDEGGRGDTTPMYKLEAIFTPEDTTNTNVKWTSDNEAVASVNADGIVTAHKGGVATILAVSEDGQFTAKSIIYVPDISEDWENYNPGDLGGFINGNTFTYEVVRTDENQKLQAAVKSSIGSASSLSRRSFDEIAGELLVVEFDWDTGSFQPDSQNRGAHLSIEDAEKHTWLALAAFPPIGKNQYEMVYYNRNGSTAFPTKNGDVNGDFNYIHGGGGAGGTYSDCENVGEGILTGANQIYTVRLELDFRSRKIRFTVTDKTNPSVTATVSDLLMDGNVSYTDSIGAIAFSHYFRSTASWTTSIDNLAVYNAAVRADRIEYTVDCVNLNSATGIKLVPVKDALSSTAKINASVVPASADQHVVFSVSEELSDYIDIDETGVLTVKDEKLVAYDNQDEIEETAGTIRISAAGNASVYAEIGLSAGPPNAAEVVGIFVDGVEYSTKVTLEVGQSAELSFVATGGDGNSDIYSYDWEVTKGDASVDPKTGILTADKPGSATVTFTLDVFRTVNIVEVLEFEFI